MPDQPKPPDGGQNNQTNQTNIVQPNKSFADASKEASKLTEATTKHRSFEQILSEETKSRNILEIHLKKSITYDENNKETKPMNITFDQLSDFIFSTLKIRPQDCLGIDYTTGRYDTREIQLKPEVDSSKYVTEPNSCILHSNHSITVKRQTNNITKVLFRNVPLNVCDEEILQLCAVYGDVAGGVKRERLYNNKDKGKIGSNRSVEIVLFENRTFENYYWLEGALPGDQGRRVTVTHPGQPRQCSHCFGYSVSKYGEPLSERCPAKGNGDACKEIGEKPRAKMMDYMLKLEKSTGYISMKTSYIRKNPTFRPREVTEEGDVFEESSESEEIVVCNPIVKMSETIEKLEKEKEKVPVIVKQLQESQEKIKIQKKELIAENAKIRHANILAEKGAASEIVSNSEPLALDVQMVTMLACLQERDQFDVDPASGEITHCREELFLPTVTQEVTNFVDLHKDLPKDVYLEKLKTLQNQVKERLTKDPRFVKGTTPDLERRQRLGSIASRRYSSASNSSKRKAGYLSQEQSKTKQVKPSSSPTSTPASQQSKTKQVKPSSSPTSAPASQARPSSPPLRK